MENKTIEWWSPSLGKNISVEVIGLSGTPVILVSENDESGEVWLKNKLIEAISYQLENGHNQVFCINIPKEERIDDSDISAEVRLVKNDQFECYIIEEVIPRIHKENKNNFIILAGVDLGAYYAVNFAFKHPENFGKLIAISGQYDARMFFKSFYNDDVYYNNPVDYMPNLNDNRYMNGIRKMDIRIAAGNEDPLIGETYRLCDVLQQKGVSYELDIWNINDQDVDDSAAALLRHVV